jgi:hypothetical protein
MPERSVKSPKVNKRACPSAFLSSLCTVRLLLHLASPRTVRRSKSSRRQRQWPKTTTPSAVWDALQRVSQPSSTWCKSRPMCFQGPEQACFELARNSPTRPPPTCASRFSKFIPRHLSEPELLCFVLCCRRWNNPAPLTRPLDPPASRCHIATIDRAATSSHRPKARAREEQNIPSTSPLIEPDSILQASPKTCSPQNRSAGPHEFAKLAAWLAGPPEGCGATLKILPTKKVRRGHEICRRRFAPPGPIRHTTTSYFREANIVALTTASASVA